jgi:hypothetical protein
MRRSLLYPVLLIAAALASACSTDDPQPGALEPGLAPTTPDQADLGRGCRDNGLIVVQLARVLSPAAPARLLQKATAKWLLVEAALLQRKRLLAQARALDLIDFIFDNRASLIGTPTQLDNVVDAILCVVGLDATGGPIGPNTGVGVVPANNPSPVVITTPDGTAGLLVPTGIAPDRDVNGNVIAGVVVTVTGGGTTPLNTPLDQYGQTVDLTASQEVIWRAGGVVVAICVTADDSFIDRLRLGHEGGLGPFFGAIEILPAAEGEDIGTIVGQCGNEIGNSNGFGGLRHLAERLFLPRQLHAAALATATSGVGGTTKKFSPFRAVDPLLFVEAVSPTSQTGTIGGTVEPPAVRIETRNETPIPGIEVTFEVTSEAGEIDPDVVATNSSGIAETDSWVLGEGTNTVVATPQEPMDVIDDVETPVAEINFDPTSVTFTAEGVPLPDLGDGYWSYRVVPAAPEDDDWTTLDWPVTAEGWSQGTAPFGSLEPACDLSPVTEWPVSQVILLRRDFYVPEGTGAAAIEFLIDNDIRVFLNGVELTEGALQHDGCADDGPFGPIVVNAGEGSPLVVGGVNELAVLGSDDGVESYLDVQVTLSD